MGREHTRKTQNATMRRNLQTSNEEPMLRRVRVVSSRSRTTSTITYDTRIMFVRFEVTELTTKLERASLAGDLV